MNSKSDPTGKKGHYQIQVKVADGGSWQGQHAVTIDYYQPNTFEMKISGVAERYLFSRHVPPAGQRLLPGRQSHGR